MPYSGTYLGKHIGVSLEPIRHEFSESNGYHTCTCIQNIQLGRPDQLFSSSGWGWTCKASLLGPFHLSPWCVEITHLKPMVLSITRPTSYRSYLTWEIVGRPQEMMPYRTAISAMVGRHVDGRVVMIFVWLLLDLSVHGCPFQCQYSWLGLWNRMIRNHLPNGWIWVW